MNTLEFNNPGELVLDESFREYVESTNPESIEFWKEWILAHPEKKDTIDTATNILRTLKDARKPVVTTDKKESLKDLLNQIDEIGNETQRPRKYHSLWYGIAATGLLFIGLTLLLNYFHLWRVKNTELSYNEIIVPLGEKAQIILSDGTHVWINSASKLRYPVEFGEVSRAVTLEGEAYFDVTKKHGKIFVVNTRDVKVNVLGTAFNVKCYPGDEKTQTTVVRGLVKVEDIHGKYKPVVIKPNEMVTLQEKSVHGLAVSKNTLISINRVDPASQVSWKDQMLVFTGESFEDLAVKMERWFNVNIKIDNDDLKSQRYNGKFVNNETVYQVLEAIKLTTPINYYIINDTIIISGK